MANSNHKKTICTSMPLKRKIREKKINNRITKGNINWRESYFFGKGRKKAAWKPYFSERRRVASVTNQDIQLNQKNIACYPGILLV